MAAQPLETVVLPRVNGRHRDRALSSARKCRATQLKLQGLTYQQIADELLQRPVQQVGPADPGQHPDVRRLRVGEAGDPADDGSGDGRNPTAHGDHEGEQSTRRPVASLAEQPEPAVDPAVGRPPQPGQRPKT